MKYLAQVPVRGAFQSCSQAARVNCIRNVTLLGPTAQFVCHETTRFGAPQRCSAVTITPMRAVAEVLSSISDDCRPATHHLLIGTVYANI
jgi:hypothetical protein